MEYEDDRSQLWPQIAQLVQVIGQSEDEQAVYACADAVFANAIGHKLFTVLAHNEQRGEVIRLYSNRPAEYPVSGSKAMGPTPWGDRVLKRGKHFIGRNATDIKWAFPDHATIAALGLESALNLPVRFAGNTLGTVNLLHRASHYHDAHLEVGCILAGLLAPVLQGRG